MVNPWYIDPMEITLRLLLAMLLGGLVGVEREQNNHPAGLRTHILVCLGSCLIMLLSIYGFSRFVYETNVRVDPARLAASVITGIGFLGAGTILFTGRAITGLTTAASLWVTAAIGLSVGAGFLYASITATVLVFLILWLVNIIEKRLFGNRSVKVLKIVSEGSAIRLGEISSMLSDHSAEIRNISLEEGQHDGEGRFQTVILSIVLPKRKDLFPLIEQIKALPDIVQISSE